MCRGRQNSNVCERLTQVILQVHFEADQFVRTKKGKFRLRADAVPTKRRAPATQCTPGPINIEVIAADHSYSVNSGTGIILNSY